MLDFTEGGGIYCSKYPFYLTPFLILKYCSCISVFRGGGGIMSIIEKKD